MERNLIKKGVVVAIILLFIGLAFAPSINANINKASVDSELVEFTTEVCGIDEVKSYKVMVTREQLDKVDSLFDSLKKQLNESKNKEESIKILNKAVVELDNIGVLPKDITSQELQQLVTGRFQNSKIIKLLDDINYKKSSVRETHYFCLMAGETTGTVMIGPVATIFSILTYITVLLAIFFPNLKYIFLTMGMFFLLPALDLSYITQANPIGIGSGLLFGWDDSWIFHPAIGWMWIKDLKGENMWEDSYFLGRLWGVEVMFDRPFDPDKIYRCLGAVGFTGLTIGFSNKRFIGTALAVNLEITK